MSGDPNSLIMEYDLVMEKEEKKYLKRYCETKLAKIIPCDLARYEFNSKHSCGDDPKEEHCRYLVDDGKEE